jgi:hypothetical protein
VEVLFREIEQREAVIVHEFDNAADFLEVHGGKGSGLAVRRRPGWARGRGAS